MVKNYYQGKTIWITGASSGIGAEMARQLSSFGASLILTARNEEKLLAVKEGAHDSSKHIILSCDLSEKDLVEEMLVKNAAILEEVDIVINNAGISQRSYIHATELAVYDRLMKVNFLATVQISLHMLDVFRRRKTGQFVTMSSVAGKFGVPERSGYSASKMALHGFFDTLRAENRKHGIGVTIICPGFIKTDISKHALTGNGEQYNVLDDGQKNGMPVDVAVSKMLAGIANRKAEILVGSMKETTMAVWISKIFPGLFRNIIAKTKTR